jgi:hypothetical protein
MNGTLARLSTQQHQFIPVSIEILNASRSAR